jgi:hypothetical protein
VLGTFLTSALGSVEATTECWSTGNEIMQATRVMTQSPTAWLLGILASQSEEKHFAHPIKYCIVCMERLTPLQLQMKEHTCRLPVGCVRDPICTIVTATSRYFLPRLKSLIQALLSHQKEVVELMTKLPKGHNPNLTLTLTLAIYLIPKTKPNPYTNHNPTPTLTLTLTLTLTPTPTLTDINPNPNPNTHPHP